MNIRAKTEKHNNVFTLTLYAYGKQMWQYFGLSYDAMVRTRKEWIACPVMNEEDDLPF